MALGNALRDINGVAAPYQYNGSPVLTDAKYNSCWNFTCTAVPAAFTGGTPSTRGAFATTPTTTLFTVTGVNLVKVFGICTVALAGATATVEVGVAGQTAGIIAQTTATNLAAGENWNDASPDTLTEVSSAITEKIVRGNIIETIATANITSGQMFYVCAWFPLTADALVLGS